MTKFQGKLPACCYAAALLVGHHAAATATANRATAEQVPFLEFKLETNVDEIAALDLDQRSIVARLATGDEEGLTEAREVYTIGRNRDDGKVAVVTIRDLSIKAGEQLASSSTYNMFVDFYGGSDYADRWANASFTGGATGGNFDFDFGLFDVEGRAGKNDESPLSYTFNVRAIALFCAMSDIFLPNRRHIPYTAAIRFGIPILHVWMAVVGLLEKAVANCQPGDTSDSGGTGGRRTQTTSSTSNIESIVDWDKVSNSSQYFLLSSQLFHDFIVPFIRRPWPFTLDRNQGSMELADTSSTRW
jgi:hypothetical protein